MIQKNILQLSIAAKTFVHLPKAETPNCSLVLFTFEAEEFLLSKLVVFESKILRSFFYPPNNN